MKVELVRIGNSRGIRIPKPLIKQCGFGDIVDLRVEKECLVIAPDRPPRQGWEEAFQSAGSPAENELLLDRVPPNEFDNDEWKW
jgi:antitoxin MazE